MASERTSRHVVYTVPRSFGMGTLLIGTTLFAAVLGTVRLAGGSRIEVIAIACFVVSVAACQLFVPHAPRLASALPGIALFHFVNSSQHGDFWGLVRNVNVGDTVHLITMTVCGGIFGYLSGVLLAGVVLLIDRSSQRSASGH